MDWCIPSHVLLDGHFVFLLRMFHEAANLHFMCFPRGNDVFLVDVVSDLMGFDVIECDFGGFVWIFVDFIG